MRSQLFKISENLTFETAPGLLERSKEWSAETDGSVTIDLASAGRTDSAGIALMLEWVELARKQGLELHIVNMPAQVQEFIDSNGLKDLFQKYSG